MTEQTQSTHSAPAPGFGNKRFLVIAGLVILVLVIVGAIFLFNRLLGGDQNAIAGAMPPDTVVLVELSALNLVNEDASRIARAFEDVFQESDVPFDADEPTSFLEQLDADLEEASGLTVSDDILPWIGPNLGIGLRQLDIEALDSGEFPQLVFAATVRNTELADKFIEDLIAAIEGGSPNRVERGEYDNVPTFEIDSESEDERLAFARSDEIFYFTSSLDLLEEAIAAQNGENLGAVANYQNTVARLPGDRALTVYLSGEAVEDLSSAAEDSGGLEGFNANLIEDLSLTGVGFSVLTTPAGIQVDAVSSFGSLSEEQQALLEAQTDDIKTAEFLPDSTYVFLVGQRLDLAWQSALVSLDNAGFREADIEEAMELFADAFGFNPGTDLMPLLDGEYSLALIDSRDGLLAEELDIDIGVVIMLGSSQVEELGSLVEDFTGSLRDQNLEVIDSSSDDVTIFQVEDPGGGRLGAYGLNEDYLILATAEESIEDLFADEASLADSEQYQEAWDAFPRGTIPVMYMEMDGLFEALEGLDPEIKNAADVNPVYAFAMGTSSDDDALQTTLIFFISGE